MAEKKLTWMVLKVDLDCRDCYKDVKKILCKFPEIQDQAFDNQRNEVRITVKCCSPEKIRDKLLCSKRGKVIKSVRIIHPSNPTIQPDQTTATAPPTPEKVIPPVLAVPPPAAALGVPVPDQYYPFPVGFGCPLCGNACYHGYGKPVAPPPCYDNFLVTDD